MGEPRWLQRENAARCGGVYVTLELAVRGARHAVRRDHRSRAILQCADGCFHHVVDKPWLVEARVVQRVHLMDVLG